MQSALRQHTLVVRSCGLSRRLSLTSTRLLLIQAQIVYRDWSEHITWHRGDDGVKVWAPCNRYIWLKFKLYIYTVFDSYYNKHICIKLQYQYMNEILFTLLPFPVTLFSSLLVSLLTWKSTFVTVFLSCMIGCDDARVNTEILKYISYD